MKHLPISVLIILCILAGCAAPRATAEKNDQSGHKGIAYDQSRDECVRSIRRARREARAGAYRMYVYGADRYDEAFARFLGEHLKARHGIELILYGPGSPERDKCYSNEMDKIIYNTFGPGILAEAEQEARELYRRE